MRVHHKKKVMGFTMRKSDGVRVHHDKKLDGVRVDHEKKSDGVQKRVLGWEFTIKKRRSGES